MSRGSEAGAGEGEPATRACPRCGECNEAGVLECARCAEPLHARRPAPPEESMADDGAMRILLPVGRSPLALAAGYLGLFSVLLVPAPLALFCGVAALRHLRRDPKKHGKGRAWFGIVMGALGSVGLIAWLGSFLLDA